MLSRFMFESPREKFNGCIKTWMPACAGMTARSGQPSLLRLGREQERIAFGAAGVGRARRLGLGDIPGIDRDHADAAAVRRHHHVVGLVLVHAELRLEDRDDELARREVVVDQNDLVQTRPLRLQPDFGACLAGGLGHLAVFPVAAPDAGSTFSHAEGCRSIVGRASGLLLVLVNGGKSGNPGLRRAEPVLPLWHELIALAQDSDTDRIGRLLSLARRGRIDRRSAARAEGLHARIAAVGRRLDVARRLSRHPERGARHRDRDPEGRTGAGLAIGAVADLRLLRIGLALDGDEPAVAGAVDFHEGLHWFLRSFSDSDRRAPLNALRIETASSAVGPRNRRPRTASITCNWRNGGESLSALATG